MCLICVKNVAADVVHLSALSFVVSLSMKLFFQSTQLSGCAEWGGEGDVDQGVFARAYLEVGHNLYFV